MTSPWQDITPLKWHYIIPQLMVRGGFDDEQEAARELHFELTKIALRRKK